MPRIQILVLIWDWIQRATASTVAGRQTGSGIKCNFLLSFSPRLPRTQKPVDGPYDEVDPPPPFPKRETKDKPIDDEGDYSLDEKAENELAARDAKIEDLEAGISDLKARLRVKDVASVSHGRNIIEMMKDKCALNKEIADLQSQLEDIHKQFTAKDRQVCPAHYDQQGAARTGI